MAGKNWQAGGRNSIPAQALVCLLAIAVSCRLAWAAPPSSKGFVPSSYVGELDPNFIWELLIGGIVVASFLAAAGLWVLTALRGQRRISAQRLRVLRAEQSRPGVVLIDARQRVISHRLLPEIYGLVCSDIPRNMTGTELLRCGASAARWMSASIIYTQAASADCRSPNCPTADRSSSNTSACRTAGPSQPMRIAPSSASCHASWHRPRS
jgi:hypothetical protein